MKSRKVLLAILGNTRYLARQALPLRGNWNLETGSEENSNFYQLLKLRAEETSEILDWLRRKDDKYTSPVIQNEILEAIALCMLRKISQNIQNATFFTIMADETADISNKEQLVVCIRWADENFAVHEDYIAMYPLERTTANHIVAVLKNCLISMRLRIENTCGQCYDGASTMAGEKTGVATQIKALNSKCIYTHCYGQALNLAVADAIKSVKCISDSLETVREIAKLVKKSPKRNTNLDKIRAETQNESREVHAFCPTRWTVRRESLEAVRNNYMELMELWEWSLDICKDTEMKARIRRVQGMMATFPFYFGCTLGAFILKHTDNLSHALQGSSMSAAQGQQVAEEVCKTLSRDRNEAAFDLFWTRLLKRKSEGDAVAEPKLPRKRRALTRQEVGDSGTHYFPSTPKEYFRHMYYAAIDVTTECIRTRFNQKDFKVYQSIQELLLKAVAGEDHDEELAKVMAVYGDTDLQQYKLEAQLSLLPEVVQAMGYYTSRFDIADLLDFFQSLGNARKLLLSETCTLGKLMLVMPATNAVSERSFSALKRVKTYLRSTTGEGRLNHLMLLHVHKELADGIDMVEVANLFVGDNQRRKQLFGKFSKNDLPMKSTFASKATQTV